jgi:hypothetical protein
MTGCLKAVEVMKSPTFTTPLVPFGRPSLDRRETMGNREAGVVCQQSKGIVINCYFWKLIGWRGMQDGQG